MWNYDEAKVISSWPEAEDLITDDPQLYSQLMNSANAICTAYAPALPEGAAVPESWLLAEVITARDLWSKLAGGNREEIGPDGMAIPVYPLVLTARTLLRPKASPLSRLR